MVKVFRISFFRRCQYLARYPVWSTLFILLIPSPTAFQQKYPLVFSPSVGDQLIYMLNTSIQAEGKDFSGKDLSLSLTASGSISLDVRRKVSDLVYVGLTSPGIQVEAQTLTGMQRTSLKTNKDAVLQAMFDPRGSLHEIHNLKALSNDQFMNMSLVQILRDYFPVLPGKAVTIGASWIDSKHINIPFQEMDLDILIETTYVLQNVIPSAEGDVAVISMDYEVSLSGAKDLGEWTGSFEGKGVGGGLLNFLLQRRCFQEFQADYQTEASLVIKKEGKALMEWPFHLSVLASAIQTNE